MKTQQRRELNTHASGPDLPQVGGNEYEARNNKPREISESGTSKSEFPAQIRIVRSQTMEYKIEPKKNMSR